MKSNGENGVPNELKSKLDEIYELFGEFERYRHHPQYYHLVMTRNIAEQVITSLGQLHDSVLTFNKYINHASNHLIAEGGPHAEAGSAGATAQETQECLTADAIQDQLEALTDCLHRALDQFVQIFKHWPRA